MWVNVTHIDQYECCCWQVTDGRIVIAAPPPPPQIDMKYSGDHECEQQIAILSHIDIFC